MDLLGRSPARRWRWPITGSFGGDGGSRFGCDLGDFGLGLIRKKKKVERRRKNVAKLKGRLSPLLIKLV